MNSGPGRPPVKAALPSANWMPKVSSLSDRSGPYGGGGPNPISAESRSRFERTAMRNSNPVEYATQSIRPITTPSSEASTSRSGTATPSSDSDGWTQGGGPE